MTIQPPPPQHPTIPVDELRPKYAILQSKRESCELQHWCISIVIMSIFFSSCALVLCGFMIVKPALATQGFREATCTVEETITLGKRDCNVVDSQTMILIVNQDFFVFKSELNITIRLKP